MFSIYPLSIYYMLFLTVWLTIIVQIGKTCIGFYYDQLYIADSGKDWSDLSAYFILRILRKNLAMGKPLKMIEGIIVTDSFWS